LTKSELARQVGLSVGALSQFEKSDSKKVPSPDTAERLAAALGVLPAYFHGDPLPTGGVVFWRKASRTPAALQRQYVHRSTLLARLARDVGSTSTWDMPDYVGLPPEVAAVTLRGDMGLLADEPVWSLCDVLERHGIWTHELAVDENNVVDACSTLVDGVAVVFLNPAKADPYRTRLSAGHEFFHLAAHSSPATGREEKRQQEWEANRFGSELLLPTDVWRDIYPRRAPSNPWAYLPAKGKYGISVKALIYKSRAAELISESEYKYALMRYGKMGWNRGEPEPAEHDVRVDAHSDSPSTSARLMKHWGSLRAVADHLDLSAGRVHELLGLGQPPGGRVPALRLIEGGA
jgi:Zn-dependent peptidase ImmA (M78 family)/transcriptional regulator with XRE-family HTH domain